MTDYRIWFGDSLKYMSHFNTEAESHHKAVRNFRDKYGFNHIKIQYVEKVETGEKYIMNIKKGWVLV